MVRTRLTGNALEFEDPALALTGHRPSNPAFDANAAAVGAALEDNFSQIAARSKSDDGGGAQEVRLYTLLARGVDLIGARLATANGWSVTAPLPFWRRTQLSNQCRSSNQRRCTGPGLR